ncbi:17391_t:CDS:1, partial [Gigaspora rosea]
EASGHFQGSSSTVSASKDKNGCKFNASKASLEEKDMLKALQAK